ncbi:MAG: D-sedoheptulose-7-phosphate isomerase [Oscillospiraceae bacterium]|jgi:D-sedoheptulose 7-phosphate isomerase
MKKTTEWIIKDLVCRYPRLARVENRVTASVEALTHAFHNGKKLLICGNGGSAADALHIVGELMKDFARPRALPAEFQKRLSDSGEDGQYICANLQGALPAIALVAETSLETAYANDRAPDLSFAQQVYGYGKPGDILLGISTSGNSKNVLYAAQVARAKDMFVIGLTGATGGRLKSLSDHLINVPEEETYKIQELHLPVYHAICLALENEFFGE